MENVILEITQNQKVGKDVYLMRLEGDCKAIQNPGEFINITVPGFFLRRPISVCDFSESHVDILYKILGHGTKKMSNLLKGEKLEVLTGLGNGFPLKKDIKKPLLIAGGIGIAPMIALAKWYNTLGVKPTLIYGAQTKQDIVITEVLIELCDKYICTDDGSLGYKGNAVSYLASNPIEFDYYYSCGPFRMLEALAKFNSNGCVSLEARMGCGFGACMGCSIKTKNGPKRVCKEGPVFEASEVEF